MRLLPEGATHGASILLRARGVRAFIDGMVAVVLSTYLAKVGMSTTEIGAVVTATLLGSAALTLVLGLGAHLFTRQRLLAFAAITMILTGLGFALVTSFWLLLPIAIIGTLNPSSGDVSIFLPTEQALLPSTVPDAQRTALFARYNLIAFMLAAVGSLAAGAPDALGSYFGVDPRWSFGSVFFVYAAIGLVLLFWYRGLSGHLDEHGERNPTKLGQSRSIVYRLAGTFALDAFGGGFIVQSMLVLWLQLRFSLSVTVTGAVFFAAGLLAGWSSLLAARIARRIGLIRTMSYTHLPANFLLMATALMPNAALAVACLLARALFSQMDVPARQSYVMAMVTPGERAAAASVTTVPRSLASALPPLAAGWMLERSTFGWPLLIGGALKAMYDVLLLWQFRDVHPPEEDGVAALRRERRRRAPAAR